MDKVILDIKNYHIVTTVLVANYNEVMIVDGRKVTR